MKALVLGPFIKEVLFVVVPAVAKENVGEVLAVVGQLFEIAVVAGDFVVGAVDRADRLGGCLTKHLLSMMGVKDTLLRIVLLLLITPFLFLFAITFNLNKTPH